MWMKIQGKTSAIKLMWATLNSNPHEISTTLTRQNNVVVERYSCTYLFKLLLYKCIVLHEASCIIRPLKFVQYVLSFYFILLNEQTLYHKVCDPNLNPTLSTSYYFDP